MMAAAARPLFSFLTQPPDLTVNSHPAVSGLDPVNKAASFRFLILKAGFYSVVIFNSMREWTDGTAGSLLIPHTSHHATVLAERLVTLILVGLDHGLFLSHRDL